MVKATTAEGEEIRRSFNWAVARRAIFKVMPDSLVCGDWTILYNQIDDAILFSVRSLFIPGYILIIKAQGKIYQFGLNWNPFWRKDLPFPVKREKGKLGYSAFSIIVRIIALVFLLYWLWQGF